MPNARLLSLLILAAASSAAAQTTRPATSIASGSDQMMNQMLTPGSSQTGQPLPPPSPQPMVDSTSGTGAVAPGGTPARTLREGSYVINRVGRLVRVQGTEQMQIVFDADSATMKDAPMLVLPNLKLMSMQNVIAGNSKDVRFRVSGLVTEFKNRNYILLDKAVVVPDIEQSF